MIDRSTYYIPWTLELTRLGMTFSCDGEVQVQVAIDSAGEIQSWTVEAIGERRGDMHGADEDRTGMVGALIADIQHDADGSFAAAIERAVDDDDTVPRPRTDAEEHGTYYRGGSL